MTEETVDITSWGVPENHYGDTPHKQNLTIRAIIKAHDPDYNLKAYAKGWYDSCHTGYSETPMLDRADRRGEPPEWYEGYYDVAFGQRDRWHTPMMTVLGEDHQDD